MKELGILASACLIFLCGEAVTSLSFLPPSRAEAKQSRSRAHLERRDVLQKLSLIGSAGATLLPTPGAAYAVGEGEQRMVFRQKPSAPMGALVPAMKQRLLLETALELASSCSLPDTRRKLESMVMPLDDQSSTQRGTHQDVKILKQFNPAKVLRGDLIRASMNLYTTNLNYNSLLTVSNPNDAYDVTDPNWKKSYIRANDGLPDLTKIIGADLDLRYLYRNQVELKMDDAAAELYKDTERCDDQELTELLREAARAFDLWLDRIRDEDVRDALEAAVAGQTTRVYDSWAAGFLPPPPIPSLQ